MLISIIIPLLNEEKTISELIERFNSLRGNFELIIVDGGSKDATLTILKNKKTVFPLKILEGTKGRAAQMNLGTGIAKGDVFWFIHCDSVISDNSLAAIERAIASGFFGGCFSLYFFDLNTIFMKYIAFTSNMRAKYLRWIFGDQGLFVKKERFQELGGYAQIPLMEDLELSKRLAKKGKLILLKEKIGTSGRRFKENPFKVFLFMQKIKLYYFLGVAPEKLNEMYREVR